MIDSSLPPHPFLLLLSSVATKCMDYYLSIVALFCLHCFDAVGWAAGTASGLQEWWGAGVVIYLEQVADLHMAQLMPLPLTVSCFSKIQVGCTFLLPAHSGSPGKRSIKWVCVCVYGAVCRMEWVGILRDSQSWSPVPSWWAV